MTHLLELRGVTKVYRNGDIETPALRGVDLCISEGEFVIFRGQSGCGKSTLLSLLGLLDEPTEGSYRVSGVDMADVDEDEKGRLRGTYFGFIYQAFNLLSHLTVVDNVALPLRYHRRMSKRACRDAAMEALVSVGLEEKAGVNTDQLSGGQQQRVAIARALVGNPTILFADEPTGNLDSRNGDQIHRLIETAHQRGTTICLVTHDDHYAPPDHRVVQMVDGLIQTRSQT